MVRLLGKEPGGLQRVGTLRRKQVDDRAPKEENLRGLYELHQNFGVTLKQNVPEGGSGQQLWIQASVSSTTRSKGSFMLGRWRDMKQHCGADHMLATGHTTR